MASPVVAVAGRRAQDAFVVTTVHMPTWTPFDAADPPTLPDGGEGRVVALVGSRQAVEEGWAREVAVGLAEAWARAGRRVVLADVGLEAPSLHEGFGLENDDGLSDALLWGASVGHVARPLSERGFYLITAGTVVGRGEDALGSPRWGQLCAGFVESGVTLAAWVPEADSARDKLVAAATDVVVVAQPGVDLEGLLGSHRTKVRAFTGVETAPEAVADLAEEEVVAVPEAGESLLAESPATTSTAPMGLGDEEEDPFASYREDLDAPDRDEDREPPDAMAWDASPPPPEATRDPMAAETSGADEEVAVSGPESDEPGLIATPAAGHENDVLEWGVDEDETGADVLPWGGPESAEDVEPGDDLELGDDLEPGNDLDPEDAAGDSLGWDEPFGAIAPAAGGYADAPEALESTELEQDASEVPAAAEAGEPEHPPEPVATTGRPGEPAARTVAPSRRGRWLAVVAVVVVGAVAAALGLRGRGGESEAPAGAPVPGEGVPEATAPSVTSPLQGFSLALESHRGSQVAWRRVDALSTLVPGVLFTTVPVEVGGRVYNRVLAGPAVDAADARRVGASVAGATGADGSAWVVRPTPMAFQVGQVPDLDVARRRVAVLRDLRLPAYVLAVDYSDGSTRYRIYVGAYESAEEASLLSSRLSEEGLGTAVLTDRLGRLPE